MTAEPPDNQTKDLGPLQWAHRIVLVFPGDGPVEGLLHELEMNKAALADRDVAWFVFAGDKVVTNYKKPLAESFASTVRNRYGPDSGQTKILLIGKDGGAKGRYDRLDLPAVFNRIDSMPMRQAEMRRR